MILLPSSYRVQLLCAIFALSLLVLVTRIKLLPNLIGHYKLPDHDRRNTGRDDLTVLASRSPQTNPKERVAVCFAGNMRTFYYDFVHDTLLNDTIAPLQTHYETDVFFYIRLDDAPPLHKPAQANGPLSLRAILKFHPVNVTVVSNGTLDPATAAYLSAESGGARLPLHHVVTHDELSTMSSRVRFDSVRNMDVLEAPSECNTNTRIRFPHTLMRSKQCLQMIADHERAQGFTYDWIYRLRPDTVFLDPVPLPHTLRRDVAYTNQANPGASKHSAFMWKKTRAISRAAGSSINDQLMFSSRRIADDFMRAYDGVDDCESYHPILSMWPPENTLRLWMMKRRIKYAALPFAWATILEYSGPTCEKLIYQNVHPGDDWKHALKLCYEFGRENARAFPEGDNWTDKLDKLPRYERNEKHMLLYNL